MKKSQAIQPLADPRSSIRYGMLRAIGLIKKDLSQLKNLKPSLDDGTPARTYPPTRRRDVLLAMQAAEVFLGEHDRCIETGRFEEALLAVMNSQRAVSVAAAVALGIQLSSHSKMRSTGGKRRAAADPRRAYMGTVIEHWREGVVVPAPYPNKTKFAYAMLDMLEKLPDDTSKVIPTHKTIMGWLR